MFISFIESLYFLFKELHELEDDIEDNEGLDENGVGGTSKIKLEGLLMGVESFI